MSRRLLLISLLAACLSSVSAFELTGNHYPTGTLEFNLGDVCDSTRFPLTPGTCTGGDPDWRTEFTTALDRWNSATSFFTLTTDPASGASTPGSCISNDPNSVFFLDTSCGSAFGGSTLAVARTSSFSDGESIHSDIIFNTAFTWGAYDDSQANHPGVSDFRRVAVHESGHTMGLGHSFNNATIMYFQSNSTTHPQTDDLDALKSIYGIMTFAAAPDLNGNTAPDIVVVRSGNDLSINAEVRDGSSGALLKNIPFLSSAFTPVGIVVLPDLDSNGAPELGLLATRNSDGRALVEIRNLVGAAVPRIIWFATDARPIKAVVVPDADSNGVAEIAVLMERVSDSSRTFVEIKNAFGATATNVLWSSRFNYAFDLAVVDDADSNGVPEIAVLLGRWSDGRGVVEIRNASGPTAPNSVWASPGVSVVALATVNDADSNGVPEVVTLSRRNSDGRILAEVKNASGATNPTSLWYAVGHSPRAVASINDADNNGVPEVAVLSRRLSDGRIVVETKNASGATAPNAIWYSPGFSPLPTLSILDDIDNNTVPEAAVMLYRTTDGRITIQERNASGANAARNVWVSP